MIARGSCAQPDRMRVCRATPPSISAATRSVWRRRRSCPASPTRILASDREVTRLGESVFRTGVGQRRGDEDHLRGAGAHGGALPQAWTSWGCGWWPPARSATRAISASFWRAPGSGGHRRGNHLRPGRGAADSPGGGEQLAAGGEARTDHRYRRRQRGDHRGGTRAHGGGVLQAAGRGPPAGGVSARTIPRAARQLHQMQEYIEAKLDGPAGRLGQSGWDRVIATSATAVGRGRRGGAHAAQSSARRSTGCASPPPRCASSTRSFRRLGLAARRKVTGIGPRRAEIIVPGVAVLLSSFCEAVSPAGVLLFAGRRARRHHRRPGGAQRGRGASRLSRDQRREVEQSGAGATAWLWSMRARWPTSASLLFDALQPLHGLPPGCGKLLEAAAYLHDVGPLHQRCEPSQAFVLRGVEFRHGGLHGTRTAS